VLGTGDQPYGYSVSLMSHDLKHQDPEVDIQATLLASQFRPFVHFRDMAAFTCG